MITDNFVPYEEAKKRMEAFFIERGIFNKFHPEICGTTEDWHITTDRVNMWYENGEYYVTENMQPEFPEFKTLPENVRHDILNCKINGIALLGTYKTFGKALLGLLKGNISTGRKVKMWL